GAWQGAGRELHRGCKVIQMSQLPRCNICLNSDHSLAPLLPSGLRLEFACTCSIFAALHNFEVDGSAGRGRPPGSRSGNHSMTIENEVLSWPSSPAAGAEVRSIFTQLKGVPLQPRRIALVGTYTPRKCGIATFGTDIFEKLAEYHP